MKNLVLKMMLFTLLGIGFAAIPAHAQKSKKEKKEKKEFNWSNIRPDELSGLEDLDEYILTCDTIWERITTYRDSITFFQIDTIKAQDPATGELFKVMKIRDKDGKERNFSGSFMQCVEMATTGVGILTDVSIITLLNASAATDLVSNPLLALKYGKCLKGGVNIISMAFREVKTIIEKSKKQGADIKALKKSQLGQSTDTAIVLTEEREEGKDYSEYVDISDIDLGTPEEGGINIDEIDIDKIEIPKQS
ncbi:hypothetical protein [Bacteroides sp. 224]|uniref:hypothetical protein n=1 Tax=Bacteroides sp. 224 TaxID=2302936 RepID=UPI0013D0AB5C|nr:hypothetical protein [Bacteroides sp. 224]NDV65261.1 hypothetical protein [Bacteroides sp. 224]